VLDHMGDFKEALDRLEEGIAGDDPKQYPSHPSLYVFDPGIACLCESAWALWFVGYPDRALERTERALSLAREDSYPGSLGFGLTFSSIVHQLRGEREETLKQAEALIAHSLRYGLPEFMRWAKAWHGWAIAGRAPAAGIAEMRETLAAQR